MTGQSAGGNAIFRRPGQAPKPGKWLSNNGSAMSFGTRLFTWLHGTYVGSDSAGNRYYRGRPIGARKRERRWVVYASQPEASKVPAEWHGWLHGTQAEPPTEEPTPSTAGSASTIAAAFSCSAAIAWNEMSCEAPAQAPMKPESSGGKKPFGVLI